MNTTALLLLFAAGPLATDPFKVDPFAEARRAVESDPFASYKKPAAPEVRKPVPFPRSSTTRRTAAPNAASANIGSAATRGMGSITTPARMGTSGSISGCSTGG